MTESTPNSTTETYDLWQSKPWWCQPWTIILTGIIIIASNWSISHTIWLTIVVAVAILVWWTYFLIIVPHLLKEQSSRSIR